MGSFAFVVLRQRHNFYIIYSVTKIERNKDQHDEEAEEEEKRKATNKQREMMEALI